jgi:hypothetical protein
MLYGRRHHARTSVPRAASIRQGDSALVRVLQAHIETLRAEIEMLERRLVAAEARAEGAIVELSAPAPRPWRLDRLAVVMDAGRARRLAPAPKNTLRC